ncbi:MAG: dynamin family protein [Deferrisomatales bacterium]
MTDLLRDRRDDLTRQALLRARSEAEAYLEEEERRRPSHAARVAAWRAELARFPARLAEEEARVAFVGAVKSGKSTLVNSLLGEDLLPRGAGILTAQVTEVRTGPRFRVTAEWKSAEEVNRGFSTHLAALGMPGPWDVRSQRHRETALQSVEGARSPHTQPLRALLRGWGEVGSRLESARRIEESGEVAALHRWAGRDETAQYLAGLRVEVPSPDLPEGLVLLDCQGADAWNAAHGQDLEDAVLSAHALVYVVSTRVGLREADFRFLEALRGYGILELTRCAVNTDLAEARDPVRLRGVVETVARQLREAGALGGVWSFSALQGLLERRDLLVPVSVSPGERGLLEAWAQGSSSLAAESREAFEAFRERLWTDARSQQQRLVLQRARADLRRTLVRAALDLQSPGLGRAAWGAESVDALAAWAQERLGEASRGQRQALRQAVREEFSRRRAPHRAVWEERIRGLDPDPAGAWVEARGDPVAAGAILRARLEHGAAEILAETEPLRINAARNLALQARGELARKGEAVAAEVAEVLARAGAPVGTPPDRRALAREITATRRVPLFRRRAPGRVPVPARGRLRDVVEAAGRAVAGRLPTGSRPLATAEAAAQRGLLLRGLRRAWDAYLDELLEDCLLVHVDEAASQVYNRIASWVLSCTAPGGTPIASALSRLDADPGAEPPTTGGSSP